MVDILHRLRPGWSTGKGRPVPSEVRVSTWQ